MRLEFLEFYWNFPLVLESISFKFPYEVVLLWPLLRSSNICPSAVTRIPGLGCSAVLTFVRIMRANREILRHTNAILLAIMNLSYSLTSSLFIIIMYQTMQTRSTMALRDQKSLWEYQNSERPFLYR